jgi:hypothetical protein
MASVIETEKYKLSYLLVFARKSAANTRTIIDSVNIHFNSVHSTEKRRLKLSKIILTC